MAVRKAGKALVGTIDRFEVRDKVKGKKTLAESMCKRAKLPDVAITPFFLQTLTGLATEKEMMEAIEDRRQITGLAQNRKPKSVGQGLDEAVQQEDTSKMSEKELKEHEQKKEREFLADVFKTKV